MSIEVQPVAATPVAKKKSSMPALIAALACLVIIGGGVAAAGVMMKTRKMPEREQEAAVAPLVQVTVAELQTRPVTLALNGTVMAARKVVVIPEVSGRVTWLNDKLVPGGMIKRGEPLLRVDGRDYALAARQQRAQLKNQKVALQMEAARREVARKEWELFQKERAAAGMPTVAPSAAPPLAMRDPQMAGAKANVTAARSGLARARLALGKTSLGAPFNAFVQMENVDKGQLVGPQSQLATLVGTDEFWVQVSVPLDRLGYVKFPAPGSKDKEGSEALVWLDTGRGRIERTGKVIRLLGDLDPVGRMARLLVEVPDPFGLKTETKAKSEGEAPTEGGGPMRSDLPLLLGSYVHVEIAGEQLQQVVELPRRALQPGNQVYVLNADNKLQILKVQTMWGTDDTVLLRGGLKGGERVILTPLPAAVEGMLLRASDEGQAEPKPAKSASADAPAKTEPAP